MSGIRVASHACAQNPNKHADITQCALPANKIQIQTHANRQFHLHASEITLRLNTRLLKTKRKMTKGKEIVVEK